jgi:stage V sporulation protein SpoVS
MLSLRPPSTAGIFLDLVSRAGGAVVVSTGLVAGAMRALAILRGFAAERIEWMTAAGFAGGIVLAGLILVIDFAFG